MVKRVLFFRPTLGAGGADRITITLLQHLDRDRFAPHLALVNRSGVLADEIPSDVPVIDLGVRRLALAVPALARAIHRLQPDVVVCSAGGANIFCAAAHRLARSQARLILCERSALRRSDRSRWRDAVELRAKRIMYSRADVVTAVSEGVASDLVESLAIDPARVRVVYNPIVSDDLANRAAEPVDHPWFTNGRPVLVAVGRLVAIKDYPTMLDAFGAIRQDTGARLVVLGEGPLRGELERRARELGVADDVAFVGYDKNPHRFMAKATALVQSSRAEGLPGALIQSLACGTPVVATDCNHGPREVVREGIDGYLVPVGDASALARRTGEIVANPALRSKLGAAGRERASRFSIGASLQLYQEAIDG